MLYSIECSRASYLEVLGHVALRAAPSDGRAAGRRGARRVAAHKHDGLAHARGDARHVRRLGLGGFGREPKVDRHLALLALARQNYAIAVHRVTDAVSTPKRSLSPSSDDDSDGCPSLVSESSSDLGGYVHMDLIRPYNKTHKEGHMCIPSTPPPQEAELCMRALSIVEDDFETLVLLTFPKRTWIKMMGQKKIDG